MTMDTITVYWSPQLFLHNNWNFLYPKPKTLFSSVKEHTSLKNEAELSGDLMKHTTKILACPAVSNKFKKIAVFESPMSCSYNYDFNNFFKTSKYILEPETKQYIDVRVERPPVVDYGPTITFSLSYFLFAEESLDAYFTPPMFHPPKYMKYGSVVPGEFDIGRWFRPYNLEIQMWNQSGKFELQENEPLFYTEFKTEKRVVLKRFQINDKLHDAAVACINSKNIFGSGQTLDERYNRFENTDMRDMILSEIKKNIISESAPIEI